ncbi:hypothetical protein ACPB2S_08980, partial [Escherichia coli]
PSISDGRLSYQFSSDGYIRRSVYAYDPLILNSAKSTPGDNDSTLLFFVKAKELAKEEPVTKIKKIQNLLIITPIITLWIYYYQ